MRRTTGYTYDGKNEGVIVADAKVREHYNKMGDICWTVLLSW